MNPRFTSRTDLPILLNELGLVGEGVEVGVFQGTYSLELLSTWRGRRLHLVDVWDSGDTMGYSPAADREGDLNSTLSKLAGYTDRINGYVGCVDSAASIPDDSLDLVFIDAEHTYDGTLADLEAFYPKLKEGGMLAGHDYSDGYSYKNYRFGVKRAVDDFVRAEGLPPPLYTLKDGESPTWYLL
eukprot:CAMPEP_0114567426 /NCGR_PEP_ID=MMETSP0114-20121206/15472_1 /TAXON_ID=31324 /ORGANISM="Goniomonas sp, Strain m" /LENGTH=183 /DNA_ID=CAMNT_0001754009 /DNA_START=42 /DNA_END=591 /DNA_ORIENTATION=+